MGYLIVNPDDPSGDPIYVEGPNPEMGTGSSGRHTSLGGHFSNVARMFDPRQSLLPYGLGLAALGSFAPGAAAGTGAPSLSTPVGSTILPGTLAADTAVTLGAPATLAGVAAPALAAPVGSQVLPQALASQTATSLAAAPAAVTPFVNPGGGNTPSSSPQNFWSSDAFRGWLVGTGSDIARTILNNNAVDDARDVQREATREALGRLDRAADENRALYENTRGVYAPYLGLGSAAASTLGGLMGLPAGGGQAASTPAPLPPPSTPIQEQQPIARTKPDDTPAKGHAMPRLGTATASPAQTTFNRTIQSQSSYQNEPLVQMQAPDGTVRAIPVSKAGHFESRGARRVG